MTPTSSNHEPTGHGDDAVEAYLDELVERWPPGRPRELRHLLDEVEAHLRDAEHQLRAAGEPNPAAAAVHRFGPAHALVAAEHARRMGLRQLVRPVVVTGLLLGGLGALAVGLSGAVAAIIQLAAGPTAVVDVAPDRILAATDCARWLAGDPTAGSCRAAAVTDWVSEIIGLRLAVGVLGVLALAGYRLLRRRGWPTLPAVLTDTVAATAFGLAAAATLTLAVNATVATTGHGWGQWAAATTAALPAAALHTTRLLQQLRRTPAAAQ